MCVTICLFVEFYFFLRIWPNIRQYFGLATFIKTFKLKINKLRTLPWFKKHSNAVLKICFEAAMSVNLEPVL